MQSSIRKFPHANVPTQTLLSATVRSDARWLAEFLNTYLREVCLIHTGVWFFGDARRVPSSFQIILNNLKPGSLSRKP